MPGKLLCAGAISAIIVEFYQRDVAGEFFLARITRLVVAELYQSYVPSEFLLAGIALLALIIRQFNQRDMPPELFVLGAGTGWGLSGRLHQRAAADRR